MKVLQQILHKRMRVPLSADTSHAAVSTTTIDPLPSIPADAKVFFKNLKDWSNGKFTAESRNGSH